MTITLTSDQQLPALEEYRRLLNGAKVLDGDIIVKDNKLVKINYGSGVANIFTLGLSDRRIRGTDMQNLESRAKFWMALKNAAGTGLTTAELEAIGNSLGLEITKQDNGCYQFKDFKKPAEQGEEGDKGTDALARRTIEHFVEIFDAKQAQAQQAQQAPQQAQQAQPQSEIPKTYIGGANGLCLTAKQFKGIFDQVESRGLAQKFLNEALNDKNINDKADRALYAKAMETLIQECRNRFAAGGASNGLFEQLFANGLGIDAVARKLAKTVVDGKFKLDGLYPVKDSGVNAISADAKKRIEYYNKMLESQGEARIGALSNLAPSFDTSGDNETKDVSARFVSELLFNANAAEVDRAGFGGGYRIANILMKNVADFRKLCTAVMRDNNPADTFYGGILDRLKEISPMLADSFTKMISAINSKCFGGGVPADDSKFRLCCMANMNKILAAIADSKMESSIDAAVKVYLNDLQLEDFPAGVNKDEFVRFAKEELKNNPKVSSTDIGKKFCAKCKIDDFQMPERIGKIFDSIKTDLMIMDNTGHSMLMVRLGKKLGLYGQDNMVDTDRFVLAEAMATQLGENSSPQSLRRMLAAGFRFSPAQNGKFDLGRIMMEMGPMTIKLLQELNDSQLDEDIKATMDNIRGTLPRMDPVLVKAQLISYLMDGMTGRERSRIKSITISSSLGAASIAETVQADVQYYDKEDPVEDVFKLLRPDVKSKFDTEKTKLLDKLVSLQGKIKDHKSEEYKELQKNIGEVKSLTLSVDGEFDLKAELRTAIKYYAALGAYKDPASLVKSMGFVLRDSSKLGEFHNALDKLKSDYDGLVRDLKDFLKKKNPTLDDVIDGIAEKYLVKPSESCLIVSKAPGMRADKLLHLIENGETVKTDNEEHEMIGLNKILNKKITEVVEVPERLNELYDQLVNTNKALLDLTKKTVQMLLTGKPPMMHFDMHGGNIMSDSQSITMIDHGKEVNITDEEQKSFRMVLTMLVNPSADNFAKDLTTALVMLLEEEKKKCGSKDQELAGDIDKTISQLKDKGGALQGLFAYAEQELREVSSGKINLKESFNRISGLIKAIGSEGLHAPSQLNDFVHTFTKLINLQEKVSVDITSFAKMNELAKCEGELPAALPGEGTSINDVSTVKKSLPKIVEDLVGRIGDLTSKYSKEEVSGGFNDHCVTLSQDKKLLEEVTYDKGMGTVRRLVEGINDHLKEFKDYIQRFRDVNSGSGIPDFVEYYETMVGEIQTLVVNPLLNGIGDKQTSILPKQTIENTYLSQNAQTEVVDKSGIPSVKDNEVMLVEISDVLADALADIADRQS